MIQADPAPQVEGPYPLSTLRHSVAHLMASAVQKLIPGAQFGFGPSIEHGFYYDFDLPEQLTDKEGEVMRLMIAGKTNREIAEICGNSTRTVELHRARIFDKLEVSNAVELVRVLGVLEK